MYSEVKHIAQKYFIIFLKKLVLREGERPAVETCCACISAIRMSSGERIFKKNYRSNQTSSWKKWYSTTEHFCIVPRHTKRTSTLTCHISPMKRAIRLKFSQLLECIPNYKSTHSSDHLSFFTEIGIILFSIDP